MEKELTFVMKGKKADIDNACEHIGELMNEVEKHQNVVIWFR